MSQQVWLPLVGREGDPEPVEVETEADGTLLLSNVAAQFPGASGLRFRNKETGGLRGVKLQNDLLHPPFDAGWGPGPYIVITATKRRAADDGDAAKAPRCCAEEKTTDLIVLNLSFSTTESEVREFFEKFGALKMCQLKRKDNGKSKGYAFVHFESVEAQRKVMMQRHLLGERWCDVKVPNSQDKTGFKETDSAREYKICVRRLEDSISKEELTKHFEVSERSTAIGMHG